MACHAPATRRRRPAALAGQGAGPSSPSRRTSRRRPRRSQAPAQHRLLERRHLRIAGGRVDVGDPSGHRRTQSSTATPRPTTEGRGDGRAPGAGRA
jgi:hypothetical protein